MRAATVDPASAVQWAAVAGDSDVLAAGFWADAHTFIFDPPRRYLASDGVALIRWVNLDPANVGELDASVRAELVRHVVAISEPAPVQ